MKTKTNGTFLLPGVALVLGAMLILHAGALSQTCTLGLQATAVPVEQLTIADIDIDNFESRGVLFTLAISNNGLLAVNAQLDIGLSIRLADGREFPTAATMRTDAFSVPVGGRSFTNLDFGKHADIGFEVFEYDDQAKDAVEEGAFSSGIFPAGIYRMTFSLVNCSEAGSDDIEFDLTNPNRVTLIAPGDGETTGEFPFFQFYHEGQRARLTVAELKPDQTYEDAITRVPPMLEVELGTEQSFQYAQGRPLESGKSYVWRVVTLTRIAGGTDLETSSPVASFTVASGQSAYDALLARLEIMFGSEYPEVFRQIKEGEFHLTGNFQLDNSSLSETELLQLLGQLQEMTDSVELTLE